MSLMSLCPSHMHHSVASVAQWAEGSCLRPLPFFKLTYHRATPTPHIHTLFMLLRPSHTRSPKQPSSSSFFEAHTPLCRSPAPHMPHACPGLAARSEPATVPHALLASERIQHTVTLSASGWSSSSGSSGAPSGISGWSSRSS